ncbi:MAG: aa3-type cytochrome c oxidase subunit IV [Hyphomicrobiales bacterium]|nr:aa3-type cytochrome c oxidase subunit IV [Hyphomicrobiales bacterium]
MADPASSEIGTATGTDLADHVRTYDAFVNLAKYGTAAMAVILILMAFFLL